MSKFKKGDQVEVIEVHRKFDKGDVLEVIDVDEQDTNLTYLLENVSKTDWARGECLKLVEPKRTKNQRITALEETVAKQGEEIAELKVIVHQLRKPSTEVVEALAINFEADADVLEFEGKQYRKVDREAREGDVVIFTKLPTHSSHDVTKGKPYKVFRGCANRLQITDDVNYDCYVYDGGLLEGTPETVDVYEIIVEDKPHPAPPYPVPAIPVPVKTTNEKRAEIIEKAKRFIDDSEDIFGDYNVKTKTGDYKMCTVEFLVNENKRKIVALMKGYSTKRVYTNGIAICAEGDVFNEHIGRAIALGRALSLDVSEFEQAVQPTIAIGQIGYVEDAGTSFYVTIVANDVEPGCEQNTIGYIQRNQLPFKIINDTNAQYTIPTGPAPVEEGF